MLDSEVFPRISFPTCAVLVAYYFPPLNVVAAQRGMRLARVLLDQYDRVYVIRRSCHDLRSDLMDYEFAKGVLDDPRLICIDATPWLAKREFSAKQSLFHRVVAAFMTRVFCSPGTEWLPALQVELRKISERESVNVVVATGPPFPPLVAVARWAKYHHLPFVLDYRDLWTANPIAKIPRIVRLVVNRVIERWLINAASIITTVSKGCRTMILRDAPHKQIRVLLNTPDFEYVKYFRETLSPRETYGEERKAQAGSVLRIVFTGQVYAHCSFFPVLRALTQLRKAEAERIQIHYYGNCSKAVRAEFENFGLKERLFDHGMVSKAAAISAVKDADVLLSLVHGGEQCSDPSISGVMTTKVFDYFLSGNPVLNIGPLDAEIRQFATEIGFEPFYSYVASDTKGISDFLLQQLIKRSGGTGVKTDVSLPNFSAQFKDILHELASANEVSESAESPSPQS